MRHKRSKPTAVLVFECLDCEARIAIDDDPRRPFRPIDPEEVELPCPEGCGSDLLQLVERHER